MEKKQIKFGVACKHIGSDDKPDNYYIIGATDGLVKINGIWQTCIEYFNPVTNKRYYRGLDDFADNFMYLEQLQIQIARFIIKNVKSKINQNNKLKSTFDFVREYINKQYDMNKNLYRAKLISEYKTTYNVEHNNIPATLDNYRRLLTSAGYLMSFEDSTIKYSGIYKITNKIPDDLKLPELKALYNKNIRKM